MLASFFLLPATLTTVVHLTCAASSTFSSFDVCDDLLEVCSGDTTCADCWILPATGGEDYDECTANFNVSAAGECGLWAITPCCAQEESGCMSNDIYNAYYECTLDVITDGECTSSSFVCPESTGVADSSDGTTDGSTGTADDTNGAGSSSSQLRTATSATAGAAAGVAMAAFCMVSALWV